jgi:glycosyltransferase involved in cell wall biosynthesis
MKILFYTPLNGRCRDIESQAVEFSKRNHRIYLLTQSAEGSLHQSFKSYGFSVTANSKYFKFKYINLLGQLWTLILFIYKNKINLVYSHLEPANFISVLAQFFVSARIIICRHHINEGRLYNFDKDFSYKLTYSLARDIIVVSNHAKKYMMKYENIPEALIHHINLAYDFDLYDKPNPQKSNSIREEFNCQILLLTICRLTKYKRPDLSIEVLDHLRQKGLDVKLIILGHGEMMSSLEATIGERNLQEYVFLQGYVHNVLDYLKASDYLIHPSLLDSSSISLKEAGLVKLPVIVCKGVGDFDDVIINGENGFLVNQHNFVEEAVKIIAETSSDIQLRLRIGNNLNATVIKEFNIKNIALTYEQKFHS